MWICMGRSYDWVRSNNSLPALGLSGTTFDIAYRSAATRPSSGLTGTMKMATIPVPPISCF